jgi:outer membrane receptor protein involved in Fe transport
VYGADAVAGVVNFIMDTDFEGVKLEANYGFNQHSNHNDSVQQIVEDRGFALPDNDVKTGYNDDFTFALGIGSAEDKGHAVFYATYRNVDSVLQADYDYSACTLNSGDAFTCGGSGTVAPARFIDNRTGTDMTPRGPNGDLRDYSSTTDAFNYGPINYYQRPDERYTAGVFTNYKLNDSADVYGEFMFMSDRSVSQIAPSGSFGQEMTVNCSNPFLTASERATWAVTADPDTGALLTNCNDDPAGSLDLLVLRRNVEGGGRQDDISHQSYRGVVGIKGDINDTWQYDASGQYGTTKLDRTYLNDFSADRIQEALLTTDGTTCTSGNPACVPWNIFSVGPNGESLVNPAALAYMQVPAVENAEAIEGVANANVTGDFSDKIQLPSANSGLAVNFGAEYRHEETLTRPDSVFQAGSLTGQGGATPPVHGQFYVRELFAEARMPFIQGKKGFQDLSAEAGYRYSDYSTDVNTDTYKFGLNYSPVDSVRFRGSFQHAVRAPNIGELFSVNNVALDGSTDPCAGIAAHGDVIEATQAQCALMGVSAAQYGKITPNSAAQYNGLTGGNQGLDPESSDTTSFGIVFQPTFVSGLVVALDYFDISIDDTIGLIGADVIINNCVSSGDPFFCNLVHRDSHGSLWLSPAGYVTDTTLNTGSLSTKGVDVQASSAFDIGKMGRLGFNLIGTDVDEFNTEALPGLGSYDCAGLYGVVCGTPTPKWRHSFRTTWNAPWHGIDVSANWRYFDSVDLDATSDNPQLAGDVPATDASLGSRSYIDLTASVTFADKYTVRVGANNLFDKDPPLTGTPGGCGPVFCNGNTYAQVYDTLGRQWFATLTMTF